MKAALLILGSFCIAYNLANLLHELGHAVAVWLCGGRVLSIVLHPFSWNWTYFGGPTNPLLVAWSGVLLGVLFAVVLSLGATLIRSPYLAPLQMLGGCALAVNGIYLFIAAFGDAGDAGDLLRLGVPRAVVVSAGLLLLAGSCVWLSLAQPLLGIRAGGPFVERLLALHGGVLPYLLAMVVYLSYRMPGALPLFLGFVGTGVVVVTVIAWGGHAFRTVAGNLVPAVEPSAASAATILAIGVIVVVAELVAFAPEA